MAQIQVQGKLDGTTTRSVLTITEITRDSNNTSFSLNFTTNLVSSSGYIGTSESLSGIVQISANGMTTQAKTVILKSSSENWSGTTIHKKNDTFNVTIPVSVTNISIKYTLKHSPSNDSATGNASMTLTKLVSLLNPFENNNELNLENPLTLSIVKYDSTYTNNLILYYKNDNNLTQLASWGNVEDGQIIQLNENQLENLYNLTSSSKTYALTWDLITLDGSTNLGDSKLEATGLITNANPIFTDFDFADINPITTAVTSNNQSIVGGVSTLQITIPTTKKATAVKGASIVSYIISDKSIDYSTSEIKKTIPQYNSSKIVVSTVDTRGNTTTVQKIITDFILYSPITINQTSATISRTNNIDEETKISFEGTFWNSNFGKADNSLSVAYKYRLKGSSNAYTTGVTTITPTISNNSFSVTNKAILGDTNNGFDVSKSYEIIVEVSDKLSVNEIDYTLNPGKNAIEIVGNEVTKINDIPFEEIISKGESILGEILFENETGVGTNITLAKNADNYSYLEIFYKDNDGVSNSTKVYSPNGKKVSLHITNLNNTGKATYIKSAQATINGTTITFVTNGFGFNGEVSFVSPSTVNTPKSNPKIYITRVVGYKLSVFPNETQPKETDYVIESGSNSQWSWQKWNSGVAECWGNFTASGTSKVWNSPVYNLTGAKFGPYNFPFKFVELPIEIANPIGGSNAFWLYKESAEVGNQLTTTHTGQYVPAKVNAFNSGTQTVKISIFVKGKWK